ncbi:weak similarity to phage integrase family [Parasynechococcus marenigrum WH 8102]|uniref:Weak similarity to phage integrase family n=1 Tax=Parasynechococcus marenigrum (strain WH8102) TaxID=84588 RepID=Q7U434_PARMW|nr:weak similarity to phage integrase family [Parasynechococcus marenigrum WH 8102]
MFRVCSNRVVPKVLEKRKVAGIKGDIVLLQRGHNSIGYYYREYRSLTRDYKFQKIEGAKDMYEACEQAVDIAFKFKSEFSKEKKVISEQVGVYAPKRQSRKRYKPIKAAIDEYLGEEEKRARSGLIQPGTFKTKNESFRLYIEPYIASKGIKYTQQIDHSTFEEYFIYRARTTALMRQRELAFIKQWINNYLLPNKLLNEMPSKAWYPRQIVRQTDRMANPAINPADWKVIIDYIRDDWRHYHEQGGMKGPATRIWRDAFWHFCLFMKNTGMSPEEILKLKWKNVEIRDIGRIDSKGERQEWLVAYINTIRAKTQQMREIPTNQGKELKRYMQMLKDYCAKYKIPNSIGPNTLVFGNPNLNFEPYGHWRYGRCWREIREELADKLKGHKFSNHPYTLYSMRATFIEDHLRRGTDIFLLARMAGHDVKELMKSYERLDIRERTKEITTIEFGKQKSKEEDFLIDLMQPEDDQI